MRRGFGLTVGAVLSAAVALVAVNVAAARQQEREFYLTVRAHQCLVAQPTEKAKLLAVVPCLSPSHRLEVYAIGHGGWGTKPPAQAGALAIAKTVCLGAFRRLTGHPLSASYGWAAFWPDPGSESTRYRDKIICSLRTWPSFSPLGPGWHVR